MLSIAYYWPVQDAYHPLNYGWNGCSEAVDTTQNATLIFSHDQVALRRSLLAIIGPGIEFSKDESSSIRRFLEAGGIVLLADDFGTGNSLLRALGVAANFSGKPLAELLYYDRQPSFPLILDFSPTPLTANVTTILMNGPSYIEVANSSQLSILARSSSFSFIDTNRDNRPTVNETLDSYPVIASAVIGGGILVLVSDPGVFVNEMINLYDNMRLFQNLLKMGGGSLFLDVAHLAKAPLTDLRAQFKITIDSIRDVFVFSKWSVYVQSAVAIVLILGFSLEILRRAKSGQPPEQGRALFWRSRPFPGKVKLVLA
jgi:hypothetical protein